MPIEILMPALSPTMEKGNLVKWLKKEGENVSSGDVVAEIETDKAVMEVEVVDDGVLGKILVPEGTQDVKVGTVIALLLQEGETLGDYKPASAAKAPDKPQEKAPEPIKETPTQKPAEQEEGERVFITPLARRIARMHGIDISSVKGTGPHGRITKEDIENIIAKGGDKKPAQKPAGGFKDTPISGMRKVIAQRMSKAKRDVPHFYLSIDVNVARLLDMRQQILDHGHKVTINDFIIKAGSKALLEVPEINATFHDEYTRQYASADIAVAVSIDGGLITPIIWGADSLSLLEISKQAKDLATKAKEGRLMPNDYQGGSFTISNLGMYGITEFQAIINEPQVAILAVGAATNGIMRLTLSVDHRAADGAKGALFLQVLQKHLQAPSLLAS